MQTENRSKTLSVTQHLSSVTAMLPLIIKSNYSYGNIPFQHIEQKLVTCTFLLKNYKKDVIC